MNIPFFYRKIVYLTKKKSCFPYFSQLFINVEEDPRDNISIESGLRSADTNHLFCVQELLHQSGVSLIS